MSAMAFIGIPTYAVRLARIATGEEPVPSSVMVEPTVLVSESGTIVLGPKERFKSWDVRVYDHSGR